MPLFIYAIIMYGITFTCCYVGHYYLFMPLFIYIIIFKIAHNFFYRYFLLLVIDE